MSGESFATLQTEGSCAPDSVGIEDGAAKQMSGFAVLDYPIVLDDIFCPACNCETRFVIEFVWANGLFGSCVRCGDERVAAFTRTTVEAA